MEDAALARYFETIQMGLDRLEASIAQTRAEMHERFEQNEARQDRLEASLAQTRAEMRERFELVDDRLRELARSQEQFGAGLVDIVAAIARIDQRIEKLQAQGRLTNTHLLDLREDMQQRFRVVNERLGNLAA